MRSAEIALPRRSGWRNQPQVSAAPRSTAVALRDARGGWIVPLR